MLLRDLPTGNTLYIVFCLKAASQIVFVCSFLIASCLVFCSYAIKKKDEIERVAKANR